MEQAEEADQLESLTVVLGLAAHQAAREEAEAREHLLSLEAGAERGREEPVEYVAISTSD